MCDDLHVTDCGLTKILVYKLTIEYSANVTFDRHFIFIHGIFIFNKYFYHL